MPDPDGLLDLLNPVEPAPRNQLFSAIDASANWVWDLDDLRGRERPKAVFFPTEFPAIDAPGKGSAATPLVEARFVQRSADYVVCYLSSQSGCQQACRFCHLTATGQTNQQDLDLPEYLLQARQVLEHYDLLREQEKIEQPRSIHFNYMARGEVFANPTVLENGDQLISDLNGLAVSRGLYPKHKFSTIMPVSMANLEFTDIFREHQPDIYYSLYSLDPVFRKRWLPKAIDPEPALAKLANYQRDSNKVIYLHWAFIAGENDSEESVGSIIARINDLGLRVNVNLVAYNPANGRSAPSAPATIKARAAQLREGFPGAKIREIQRVGFDVKASCGMFVNGNGK